MPKATLIAEAATVPAPDEPRPRSWSQRRDQLRAWLEGQSLGIGRDEIEAHFAGMSAHYWERVTESELGWGLETIQRFLRTVAAPNTPATMPIMDWRELPGGDGTRVLLCTWDRHGLLAKAAACFSAANLSIQQADIFTRTDHIVLDVFRVRDSDRQGPAPSDKLEQMSFLLDGALSEPPRFASVWACSRHKFLAPPARLRPRITFDNASVSATTLVRIEASDRLGLLYDVLQVLAEAGLNVTQAAIETDGAIAQDLLHVTDAEGGQVLSPARLQELHRALETAILIQE